MRIQVMRLNTIEEMNRSISARTIHTPGGWGIPKSSSRRSIVDGLIKAVETLISMCIRARPLIVRTDPIVGTDLDKRLRFLNTLIHKLIAKNEEADP